MTGVRVSPSCTINVRTNTYSVPSRLIGHRVDVRIGAEQLEVLYQGISVQVMPRLTGKNNASINYRHIIDSLVRKPGAFAAYRYRDELFPTTNFRIAYDLLHSARSEKEADRQYLKILDLAAKESQDAVADALRHLIASSEAIDFNRVNELVLDASRIPAPTEVDVPAPDLAEFDFLIPSMNKECSQDGQDNINEEDNATVSVARAEQTAEQTVGFANRRADDAVEGTASTNDPRSIPADSSASGDRRTQSHGVSFGADDKECEVRREGRVKRLMTRSKLPLGKTWASLEIDRFPLAVSSQLEVLRDGSFLDRRENILIFGKPGSGKSHALCALASV